MAEENKHSPTTEEQAPPEMPGKALKMEQAEIPDVGDGPAPSAKVIDLSAVRSTPEKDAPTDIPKEPEAQRVWGHPNKRFRSAEIASVNTLALLAANALPRKPREKRRQRRFLRSLRSTVFYDCVDNSLDEPQLAFIEGIKLNIDPLLCSFIGSHIGIKVFVHGDTEHCYHLEKGV